MKNLFLLVILLAFTFLICSCGVDRIYTSATYGTVKPYTEKPVFDKETAENKQHTYNAFYFIEETGSGSMGSHKFGLAYRF